MPKKVIEGELRELIESLAMRRWSPSEIHRFIRRGVRDGRLHFEVPHVRTIERHVQKLNFDRDSEPWTLADAEGDDATLILPAMSALMGSQYEEAAAQPPLTRTVAKWLLKVRRAAPELRVEICYLLALMYAANSADQSAVMNLDSLLALEPWTRKAAMEHYFEQVDEGWLTLPPTLIVTHMVFDAYKGWPGPDDSHPPAFSRWLKQQESRAGGKWIDDEHRDLWGPISALSGEASDG